MSGVESTGSPTWLNTQNGETPAPYQYTFPPGLIAQLLSATATYDGSGASTPFLACLSFYSQTGNLLSRVFPQTPVPSGGTAQVSFAPFPGGLAGGSSGGSGWQFNTDNEGGWGEVTSNAEGPKGYGLFFADESGTGVAIITKNNVYLESTSGDEVQIGRTAGTAGVGIGQLANVLSFMLGKQVQIECAASGMTITDSDGTVGITIDSANAGAINVGTATNGVVTVGGASQTLIKGDQTVTIDGGTSFVVAQSNNGQDGVYIDGAGDAYLFASSFNLQVNETSGFTLNGLPTVAGPSGTLWNNAGVVSVAP